MLHQQWEIWKRGGGNGCEKPGGKSYMFETLGGDCCGGSIDEVVLEVLLLEVDFDGALSGERDLSLGNGDGVLTSRFSSL
ncbi:hypothetical protein Tco_1278836 [Tanacetum coccineum]